MSKIHELIRRFDEMRTSAQVVLSNLKLSPGGDQYEYKGSMNEVEGLKDAIQAVYDVMNYDELDKILNKGPASRDDDWGDWEDDTDGVPASALGHPSRPG